MVALFVHTKTLKANLCRNLKRTFLILYSYYMYDICHAFQKKRGFHFSNLKRQCQKRRPQVCIPLEKKKTRRGETIQSRFKVHGMPKGCWFTFYIAWMWFFKIHGNAERLPKIFTPTFYQGWKYSLKIHKRCQMATRFFLILHRSSWEKNHISKCLVHDAERLTILNLILTAHQCSHYTGAMSSHL